MKDFYSKLCLAILEEHFGSIIHCIGNSLLYGTKSLVGIRLDTHLSLTEVYSKINNIFIKIFLFFQDHIYQYIFFPRVDKERTECPYKIWICHLWT